VDKWVTRSVAESYPLIHSQTRDFSRFFATQHISAINFKVSRLKLLPYSDCAFKG